MTRFKLLVALMCLGTPLGTAPVHAWGLGISIGLPVYYPRPYGYPYYYYQPYPYVYAAPAPLIVPPSPVIVQPAAVVQTAQPAVAAPAAPVPAAPAPAPARAPALGPPPSVAPVSTGIIQANNSESAARVEQLLQLLSSPQDNARRDAALDLGRLKATSAVQPLIRMLSSDTSPVARDGAARALGLIGSSQGLTALIQAAQLDADRDVRHSAQFAVEVIRTNLRGN
jgi:hypothetical protein